MASSGNYELLCLENPLFDIQAQGDTKLLEKYGLKPNDAILAEEKHMGIFKDLLQNYEAKIIAGGAAQNTARGAAYILPPSSVVYIGCVGQDEYSDMLRRIVKEAGVRAEYRVEETQPTGRCGVVITGHDRSMCTDLGAANHYKIEHLKSPEIWKLVEQAKIYFVGGYHLTVCVEAILALAEEAAAKNKAFVLSLAAPFIPKVFAEPFNKTLEYCDYIIGNELEALAYAESHNLKTESIQKIAEHLSLLPKKNPKRPRFVIITQGTGNTIGVKSMGGEIMEITEYYVHAIDKNEICDTNGAGDAFAGGYLAGVVQGWSPETCVDMGHWLARLSITQLGPSYPFPKQTYQADSYSRFSRMSHD